MKYFLTIVLFLCLAGCSSSEKKNVPVKLQHPQTRELVMCHERVLVSAEECARNYEKEGFVRLKNKSFFPGGNDELDNPGYPTRRYRDKEQAPRW